jgi:hypothetical protein
MQVPRERGGKLLLILDHKIGVSVQRHTSAALYPREMTPGTHCTGGWMGPIAGLDTEVRGKILYLCRGLNLVRPICSQTVY